MTGHRTMERVRAEFLEMPGLRLTLRQVERLCGVDQSICKPVLDALVDARFLRMGADGTYARLTDSDVPRPRPAKVEHASAARPTSQKVAW
jgi:hypothetical protein